MLVGKVVKALNAHEHTLSRNGELAHPRSLRARDNLSLGFAVDMSGVPFNRKKAPSLRRRFKYQWLCCHQVTVGGKNWFRPIRNRPGNCVDPLPEESSGVVKER